MQTAFTLTATGQPDPAAPASGGPAWWRRGVGYEIYIRSFFDSNGDGIGDLAGITAKLDYVADLGVDVMWITPFYPSPGRDHGYDVSDYTDIDPRFGTLVDFDELIRAAHDRNLRVFADIVPNHTSSDHRWFREAIADPTSQYRGYYIFRPAAADGGPPNNWVSHFGGPAWTLDPAGSGEYYCHLFLPEQPDLDWSNPAVMNEFLAILRFWCDRGVDGFRIDVAHGLTKDPELRDNPQVRAITPGMHPIDVFESFDHIFDLHRRETIDIFRHWKREISSYGAVLFGELDTRDLERFGEFVGDEDGLDGGFILKISAMSWDPPAIINDLLTFNEATSGGAAWALSNHDQPRVASRFGGGEVGVQRALAVMTSMLALDGITFLYQGEELGLPNAVVVGDSEDPLTTRNGGAAGRDVARGPVPWTPGRINGFTTADRAWLRTEPLPASRTAQVQIAAMCDGTLNTLHRYRTMIRLRTELPQLWSEPLIVDHGTAELPNDVLILHRGDVTVVANFGAETFTLPRTGASGCTLVFESRAGGAVREEREIVVAAETTVVLQHGAST